MSCQSTTATSSSTSLSSLAGVVCGHCPSRPETLQLGPSSPLLSSSSSLSSSSDNSITSTSPIQPRWVAAASCSSTNAYLEMVHMMQMMMNDIARRPTSSSTPSSPSSSSPTSDEDYFYEQSGGSHHSIVSEMAGAQSTSTSIEITYILNGKISSASGHHRQHRSETGQQPQQPQLALQPQWALLGDCNINNTTSTTTTDVLVECIKITPINGFVCFIGLDRTTCDLVLKPFSMATDLANSSNADGNKIGHKSTKMIEGRQVVLVYANGSFHLKDLNSSLGVSLVYYYESYKFCHNRCISYPREKKY